MWQLPAGPGSFEGLSGKRPLGQGDNHVTIWEGAFLEVHRTRKTAQCGSHPESKRRRWDSRARQRPDGHGLGDRVKVLGFNYTWGRLPEGLMWGAALGVGGSSEMLRALESALWPLWIATWTVLNKEESYSLKHQQSANVTCFIQLIVLVPKSPNPFFFCQGGWGIHYAVFLLHWRPSRVERNPEEHRCGC